MNKISIKINIYKITTNTKRTNLKKKIKKHKY